MQLIISQGEKLKLLHGSIESVKQTFFTDDLIKPGSYILLKSSEINFLNAVCFADCHNDVNPNDEFLLSLSDESGALRESTHLQPRSRVIGFMEQYLTGDMTWSDDIEWN